MPESLWKPVDRIAELARSSIHVWRIPLMLDQTQRNAYESLVTAEELARARRFLMDRHQVRFLAGRARMRCLLASYLGVLPRDVHICYENLGKPYLDSAHHGDQWHFNFSNSHDWGLLAVSDVRRRIGVDLESIRANRDLAGLAARYFHPSESAAIQQDSPEEAVESFYRCWTRKEAFLKATGKGLTFPLRDVVVSCRAREPAAIITINNESAAALSWHLTQLIPLDGFVGAVVHESPSLPVLCYAWSENHSGL